MQAGKEFHHQLKQVRSFIISFPLFLLSLMGEVALLVRIWLGSCALEEVVSRKAWLEDNPLELFSLRVHRQQRVSMMTEHPPAPNCDCVVCVNYYNTKDLE